MLHFNLAGNLSSSLGETLATTSAAISHVIPAVLRTISAMSVQIREAEHMTDFLLRLLALFNNLGMSSIYASEQASKSETAGLSSFDLSSL